MNINSIINHVNADIKHSYMYTHAYKDIPAITAKFKLHRLYSKYLVNSAQFKAKNIISNTRE